MKQIPAIVVALIITIVIGLGCLPSARTHFSIPPQQTTIMKLDPLPPVPSLNDLVSGSPVQPLPAPQQLQIQPSTGFTLRFRTGGSR
jgi:hypothetical protein